MVNDSLYNDDAIIRSVTYHGKAGHKISLELDPEGWERLKGMETTRCMMVLVPIQNDGQPDPDAKPYPSDAEVKMLGGSRPDKPRQRMADLSRAKQAGILCNDQRFQEFAQRCGVELDSDGCWLAVVTDWVRQKCKVTSRAQLDTDLGAGALWDLLRADYDAWRGAIGRPDERA